MLFVSGRERRSDISTPVEIARRWPVEDTSKPREEVPEGSDATTREARPSPVFFSLPIHEETLNET